MAFETINNLFYGREIDMKYTCTIVTSLFVGWIVGMVMTNHQWKIDAIDQGYAQYIIIDKETGETSWHWLNGKREWAHQ